MHARDVAVMARRESKNWPLCSLHLWTLTMTWLSFAAENLPSGMR